MITTFEELYKTIRNIIDPLTNNDCPYVYDGKFSYGYWKPEQRRPYLTITDDLKGDDWCIIKGNIEIVFCGQILKNRVYIDAKMFNDDLLIKVTFGLDSEYISDKSPVQMALFACDINTKWIACKALEQETMSFKYDYRDEKKAYFQFYKEFQSISEDKLYFFFNSALSVGHLDWQIFIYTWLSELEGSDYLMLDEDTEYKDILRENIEIEEKMNEI